MADENLPEEEPTLADEINEENATLYIGPEPDAATLILVALYERLGKVLLAISDQQVEIDIITLDEDRILP